MSRHRARDPSPRWKARGLRDDAKDKWPVALRSLTGLKCAGFRDDAKDGTGGAAGIHRFRFPLHLKWFVGVGLTDGDIRILRAFGRFFYWRGRWLGKLT